MNPTQQVCTFAIAEELFGLEVHRVQEVLRSKEMTRVPLAQRVIRGLINLRGQIVLAVDLRRCLELADAPDDSPPMNLVIQTDDGPVSFLVDRIHDVVDVDERTFEPTPPNLHGPTRKIVRGSYPLGSRLLLVVDADAVLAMLEVPPDRRGDDL